MKIEDIHFHDSVIRKEVCGADLILDIDYPTDWANNIYESRRLVFSDSESYTVHEGAFSGDLTILDVSITEHTETKYKFRIDTNAGYRELVSTGVSLLK